MIGWVILAFGLSASVVLNLLVDLWHAGENKRLPRRRWPHLLLQVTTMSFIGLGTWFVMGTTKAALVAGLGAWGVNYLVREIGMSLQVHRDFERFVMMKNDKKPW